MTSLEELSLAEFSGEYARSKVYENDHKNVLGIWLDLVSNVKYSTILIFKVKVKNWPKLSGFFFIEEYKNGRAAFINDIF